jgi:nitrate/TMAO reductase-like tetraheme cytochrome c subunit
MSFKDDRLPENSDQDGTTPDQDGTEVVEPETLAVTQVGVTHQFFAARSVDFFRMLRNWVGLLGTVMFATSFITFLFFFLIELIAGEVNPYLGLFHFLVLPPIATFGLLMMGVGYWIERRKKRRALESGQSWAPLDISRTRVQQRLLLTAGGMSAFMVFVMAAGGYRAFEFTESTEFCGEVCHSVMHPEYIAYQASPHARVSCVDCHVGEGASYYVQSKLSGLYQVYAVLRNIYPKPIPTPVHNLRPAQETCEQCHWPRYFFGDRRVTFTHYLTDGSEEPWVIDMLINIGGGDPDKGYTRGIHWHMNIANKVDYVARDPQRQEIPWVRIVDELGNTTIYQDVDNPLTEEELAEQEAAGEMRQMDCIDCHNRPSHIYRSPVELVNRELQLGNIDPAMPDIKFYALELLAADYPDVPTAEQSITDGLREAYSSDWPDFYAQSRRQVDETAVVLKRVYGENTFPDMKVRWDTYPDFIGHWGTAGCFRCHAGNLQSSDGRVISTDCDSCHVILSQGFPSDPVPAVNGRNPFVHPGDLEVMDEPILCHDCHDGALGLGG